MFPERLTRSFLDHGVLSRLAGFPLLARRPMLGSVSGRHPSPHRGSSVEFAEYRKYVPGDDLRRLDWRAYGRSDRFFVKEFEADTNLRCCLVLDTSGSMGFGSVGISKLEYARRLAGSLGHLALQQGDAVGLACVAGGIVRNIPPKRNPSHLMTVFDVLEQTRPEGPTQLVPVLHELAETISQRALVVTISDLFVGPPSCVRASSICDFGATTWRSFTCSTRGSWRLIFGGRCGFWTWKGGRRSSPSLARSPTATTRRSRSISRICSRSCSNPPSITTE